MTTLGSLYINPTRFCNLRCKHCWIAPPHKEKLGVQNEEMSIGEIIDIVKAGMELGLTSIKLTGGEPLLREDLEDLIAFCSSLSIRVQIETNGTLVDREKAKMFKRHGVGHISVSLDSYSEETNDFFRGEKGAFARAIKGIENLRDELFAPQVIMSLYRENLKNFDRFMDLMESLSVNNIKVNIITPMGRGADMAGIELVPSIEEVIDFARAAQHKYADFNGSMRVDVPMAFQRLEGVTSGCGICSIKSILGVLSDGSVSICGVGFVKDDLIFGNVRNEPGLLKDIWENNPVLKKIREDIPSKIEGVCSMCVFNKRCLGGCRAEAYYNTGSFTEPSWFCQGAYDKGLFPKTRLIPEELRAR